MGDLKLQTNAQTRRGFLGMMVGGIAAAAAVRTFPFRVFSFPSEPLGQLGPYVDYVNFSEFEIKTFRFELGKPRVFLPSELFPGRLIEDSILYDRHLVVDLPRVTGHESRTTIHGA